MLPKRSLRVGLLFALVAAGPVCPAHAQDKNAELRQLLKERCDSLEFAENASWRFTLLEMRTSL